MTSHLETAHDSATPESGETPEVPRTPWSRFRRRFRTQRVGLISLGYLIFVVGIAVLAPLLATDSPNAQDLRAVLASPSGEHWLGTDDVGRDVFSRLLYASRTSLLAALLAVAVALGLGLVPGLVAGYARGRIDGIVMRIADALMAFPPLILAVALVGVLGPGLTNAMIAVGIVFSPRFLRILRGAAMSIREETYIEAARGLGCSSVSIIGRHVLPNVLSPLIVQISFAAGTAMLAEASLSFLGLGVQPPDASWGAMLGRSYRFYDRAPWVVLFPGIAIALTVLAFNLLGDALRDSLGREER
ncbi:ABC transporter permease [Ilumatobacter nonamiensis]|uniref:ABC transporter permease n=1 Tax=Ilumatobacter nonamiensis TaxID=467093 RepID=UPI000344F365|nr:ABC transporter permease [Ilumatobacter nonamiensis]